MKLLALNEPNVATEDIIHTYNSFLSPKSRAETLFLVKYASFI